jgi:ubiquinone/menaquinone biosynthesis C-methylase UbiE
MRDSHLHDSQESLKERKAMSTVDVYRITDQLDEATLQALVNRLEARGKHPRFIEMMQQYLDAMDIDSAATVLDLGCGTGVASRAIARRKRFAGRVTGIDRSPYLSGIATRLAQEEGLHNVEFRAGDSHSLGLGDAAFDAVIAHTLLSHVEDERVVLKEIVRVVKRGGKVGIFDGDYASMTLSVGAAAQAQAMNETIIGAQVTKPWIMREMPGLLREAGLERIASFGHVVADIGTADFFAPTLQALRRLLPKSGATSEGEANAWADAMMRRSAEGTYFASSNFYSYVAVRR